MTQIWYRHYRNWNFQSISRISQSASYSITIFSSKVQFLANYILTAVTFYMAFSWPIKTYASAAAFSVTTAQLLVSACKACSTPYPDFEQLDCLTSLLEFRPQGNTQISLIGLSTSRNSNRTFYQVYVGRISIGLSTMTCIYIFFQVEFVIIVDLYDY